MIKPLLSLALSALFFPAVVHAAVINIEYTGYVSVTEGAGMGYNLGDAIAGHVQIDFNKALGFNTPSDNVANYYTAAEQHDFISGYHATERGRSFDMVDVYDATHEHEGTFEDYLYTSDTDSEFILDDYFNFTSNVYSMYLMVLLPGIDWLDINNLQNLNVNITDPAVLAASRGQVYNVFAAGNADSYTVYADVAQFTFSSLKITTNDVAVPEANTLLLLMVAFAGLLLSSARKKIATRN